MLIRQVSYALRKLTAVSTYVNGTSCMQEKKKIKKALEKGNKDAAAIYAQNCIRKRKSVDMLRADHTEFRADQCEVVLACSEANNMLKLASRVDSVMSRIQGAMAMKQVICIVDLRVKKLCFSHTWDIVS